MYRKWFDCIIIFNESVDTFLGFRGCDGQSQRELKLVFRNVLQCFNVGKQIKGLLSGILPVTQSNYKNRLHKQIISDIQTLYSVYFHLLIPHSNNVEELYCQWYVYLIP